MQWQPQLVNADVATPWRVTILSSQWVGTHYTVAAQDKFLWSTIVVQRRVARVVDICLQATRECGFFSTCGVWGGAVGLLLCCGWGVS